MPSAYIPKRASCRVYYLSKQNCDEIFGVVDVVKLADDSSQEFLIKPIESPIFTFGYEEGFEKAMELNKDKVFTLEDVILIAEYVRVASQSTPNERTKNLVDEYLSTQPTEIEVVIEMECLDPNCDGIDKKGVCIPGDKPKLDSSGFLVLRKL